MPTCPFDLDAIQLQGWVSDVVYRETIKSTSDLALQLAAETVHPPGPPLLVLAGQQTRGRGQRGRRWESGHGSLTFSLLFTHSTPLPLETLPPLALATALGLAGALSSFLATSVTPGAASTAMLKWPNDVIVGDRKICGVLVEPGPATLETPSAVVVGVGVNVNNTINHDLAEQATSLAGEVGSATSLTGCLLKILEHVEREIEAWRSDDPRLPERWNLASRDLDRHVAIETPGGNVAGTCRGIDPEGRLLLEDATGSLQRIVSKIDPRT